MSSLRRRKPPARQPMPPAYFPAIPSPRVASAPTSPTRPSSPSSPDSAGSERDLQGAYLGAYAAAFGAAAATRMGRGYAHTGGYAEAPTPVPAILQRPRTVSRRRIVVAAVALSVLVLVAIALVVLPPLRHSGVSGTVNAAESARRATAPLASLPADVSVPANGSYTRTRALASGELHVDQWIRSGAKLSSITLSVPPAPGLTAGMVRASHVLVSASSTSSRTPSSVGAAAETYRFSATHAVHLSYDLSGAVERSSSSTGRALARVVALDVSYPGRRGPSTTSVVGARVLTLACSAPRADAVPRPCGEPGSDSWTVQLDGPQRNDRVLAQLDLR